MIIVADENMTGLSDSFGRHAELRLFAGRALDRTTLRGAEALLVRSVTPVNAALLAGTDIRFVGSATIGTDHLDTDWLDARGIRWAAAPGCNADAAAQYTLGMIALAAQKRGISLQESTVAIIGHGNVGSRLHKLLDALTVEVLVNDPPLADSGALEGVDLNTALEADIVTLHVPLTRSGRWPTWRMLEATALSRMRPGSLLVNAARGDIVDGPALLDALRTERIYAAFDVWPGEPEPDLELVRHCTVASPHVAGYSVEGKQRGTRMIHRAWLAWATRERGLSPPLRPGVATVGDTVARGLTWDSSESLESLLIKTTGVAEDDRRMRSGGQIDAKRFDLLRKAHSPRHEYSRIRISPPANPGTPSQGFGGERLSLLRRLGFQTA